MEGIYDNFTDIILRIAKVTWMKDIDTTYKAGDQFITLGLINVAKRNMRVYYDKTLIYDAGEYPAPSDKWKVAVYTLERLSPPPASPA